MKKNITAVLFLIFCLFTASAMAQESVMKGVSIEAVKSLSGLSVTGSPVPVSYSNTSGFLDGMKVVVPVGHHYGYDLRATLGIDWQDGDISIGGVDIGKIKNQTYSATVRNYFADDGKVSGYVGVGAYQESHDGGSLASGALKMSSANSSGILMEVGGTVTLAKIFNSENHLLDSLYIGGNVSKKFGQSKESEIRTTVGNALVTRLGGSNDIDAKVSVGWKF